MPQDKVPARTEMSSDFLTLAGRRALVTGGASGIGLYCAWSLVANGAHVTITTRHEAGGREVVAELGPCCELIVADLGSPEGVELVSNTIAATTDRLDILVNNAGITWGAPLGDYPAAAFNKVLQLDVVAPFDLVQSLLPLMEKVATDRDPARIVNLGSIDGHAVGGFDNFAYSTAKAGLHHMTRVLAYRLGPRRITVNCIAPGPIPTRMTAALLSDVEHELVARSPLGRLCEPDDITSALMYLVGPGGRFVTGVVIPVDGGLSIGPWWPADTSTSDRGRDRRLDRSREQESSDVRRDS